MMNQIRRFLIIAGLFLPVLFYGLTLDLLPINTTVGASTRYEFYFSSTQTLPGDCRIEITFEHENFDYGNLVSATLSGHDGTMAIESISNHVVHVTRSGGTDIPPGSNITLSLDVIRNPTRARTYLFGLRLETTGGGYIDAGTRSYPIKPDQLDHFDILDEPVSVTAGNALNTVTPGVRVIAYDQYHNEKTNYDWTNFRWESTDPGAQLPSAAANPTVQTAEAVFSGALFTLYAVPQQRLRARDIDPWNPVQDESDLIHVLPGALADFDITLDDLTPRAGASQTIRITHAEDVYGNPWIGSIAISVSGGGGANPGYPGPTLPADVDISNGTGTNHTLVFAKATPTVLAGSADGVTRETEFIDVEPGGLDDFTLQSDQAAPQAGETLVLSAGSARDAYGNNWSGLLSVTGNQGNSPDGTPPSLNDIFVNKGTGSVNQILVRAAQTTLTATANSISENAVVNVRPGDLFNFTISDNVPSVATAGQAFSNSIQIMVTAFDRFGNRKTDYAGLVTWTSTGTHTLPLDNASAWSNGRRTFQGDSFTLFSSGTRYLTVQDGAVSQQSTAIVVSPNMLFSYDLSCDVTQWAGRAFWLNVANAVDQWGNPWSGMVAVGSNAQDSPNNVSPTLNDVSVNNGSGQQKQILVAASPPNVYIRGLADGRERQQEDIVVLPDSVLSRIRIRDAGGNMGSEVNTSNLAVGEQLALFAAGYDLYDNYRGDERSDWTSTSGLIPSVSANQNIGHITFSPTAPGTGTITATSRNRSQVRDNTGIIMVRSGQLDHFTVEEMPVNWIKGQPFFIRIVARDNAGNPVGSFAGPADLSDQTGTVTPATTGAFSNGEWSGAVTIDQVWDDVQITVTSGAVSTPSSDRVNIVPAPGILLSTFRAVQSDAGTPVKTVTTDQTRDWFIHMVVKNLSSAVFRLDSVRLVFTGNDVIRRDYIIAYPETFRGSGTALLGGNATDSLLVRIDTTGHDPGPLTLECTNYFTNTITGQKLTNNARSNILVQTPAQISIQQLRLSKQEVTQGQTSPWDATLIVKNFGQSAFAVDSSRLQTYIEFQLGYDWTIGWPSSFAGGDWILENGETDSLIFSIAQTGIGAIGPCTVSGRVSGVETNTQRQIVKTGQANQSLQIENPPELRIVRLANLAENRPRVNVGQAYSIEMEILNSGQDNLKDVRIHLQSSLGSSGSVFTPDHLLNLLQGGETKTLRIDARAPASANASEIIQVTAEGVEDNTGYTLTSHDPMDDTTRVVIQNPARLDVVSVIPSEKQLLGGRVDEWRVKVVVQNPRVQVNVGQAAVWLNPPNASDIRFKIGNTVQEDYTVIPPTQLQSGSLRLAGGLIDTLVYRITGTGRIGGDITVEATIQGVDDNRSALKLTGNNSAAISVLSEDKLRVMKTDVEAYHKISDVAYVNTEQAFEIQVEIENGLGSTLRNVKVVMDTDGESVSADSTIRWINELKPSETATLIFPFTAATIPNQSGEVFTASIASAIYQFSGQPVAAGASIDSSAKVITQTPADLMLDMRLDRESGIYTINQQAVVTVHLANHGQADYDESGILIIDYPATYVPTFDLDTLHVGKRMQAQWTFKTPANNQSAAPITVQWFQRPRDANTGNMVRVINEGKTGRNVSTIDHWISTEMRIADPAGATDDTISTDQRFQIQAVVRWSNVNNIKTTLTIPQKYGYKTQDNPTQSVRLNPLNRDTLTWLITAPSAPSAQDTFLIVSNGMDAIAPNQQVVGFPVAPLYVTTVEKAELELSFAIIGPKDAMDGSLALQQEFRVRATVIKHGEADTLGATQVSIDPLPTGYTSSEPLTKSIVNGIAEWTLKAPHVSTGRARKIEAEIVQAPLDENTGLQVAIRKISDSVPVTAESYWLSVTQNPLPGHVINTIVPGQKGLVRMMSLSFDNRGRGSNEVQVVGLKFRTENRFGEPVPSSSVFSRLLVVNDEDTTWIYGESLNITQSSEISIQFSNALNITVDGNPSVSVFGAISPQSTQEYVLLNLFNDSYVMAKDRDSDYQVPVRDQTEQAWQDDDRFKSPLKMIYRPEEAMVLWASPNPFGQPGKEETTIRYYIEEQSDVSLKIYTLIGELVWSIEFPATDPRASAGPHAVVWRAMNDQGRKVLNGVYLLVLETGQGVTAKFKLAVVK